MKRMLALIFGLSVMSFSCAMRTSVRQHPEFAARKASIASILVVLPQVVINRRVAGGQIENLNDESEKTAVTLSELVVKEFSTRGFAAVSAHELQIKDLKQTTTIRDRFQELSNAMWDRLPEPEGEAKSFQYTLSNFKSLATDTPIDAVIYVRFSGFTRSGGDIAGEVASKTLVAVLTAGFFVQPKDLSGAAVVDIAVVDGRSGDILWGNKVGDSYWGLTGPDFKTDDLTELVSKLLAEFPRRGGDNPSSDIPVEKHNN